uniref:FHA domain-containing protein n=1 Tax=Trichuris muris TaxID=70415 RepID=A0A5S6Q484_TRIMR
MQDISFTSGAIPRTLDYVYRLASGPGAQCTSERLASYICALDGHKRGSSRHPRERGSAGYQFQKLDTAQVSRSSEGVGASFELHVTRQTIDILDCITVVRVRSPVLHKVNMPLYGILSPVGSSTPSIKIEKKSFSVGRDPSCDVVLKAPGVLSVHGFFTVNHNNELFVKRSSEQSRVAVGGQEVTCAARIKLGDEVQLGDAKFTFNRNAELEFTQNSVTSAQSPFSFRKPIEAKALNFHSANEVLADQSRICDNEGLTQTFQSVEGHSESDFAGSPTVEFENSRSLSVGKRKSALAVETRGNEGLANVSKKMNPPKRGSSLADVSSPLLSLVPPKRGRRPKKQDMDSPSPTGQPSSSPPIASRTRSHTTCQPERKPSGEDKAALKRATRSADLSKRKTAARDSRTASTGERNRGKASAMRKDATRIALAGRARHADMYLMVEKLPRGRMRLV